MASRHGRFPQARRAGAAGRSVSMAGTDLWLSQTGSPLKAAGFPARITADGAPAGSPEAVCEGSGRGSSGQRLQRAHSLLIFSPAATAAPARALFGQEEAAEVLGSHQRPAGRTCKGSAERMSAAEPDRTAVGDPESSARPAVDGCAGADSEAAPATDSTAGAHAHAVQDSQESAPYPEAEFDQGACLGTSPAQGGEAAASEPGAGLAAGSGRGAEARTRTAQGAQEAAPGSGAPSAGGSGQRMSAPQDKGHTETSMILVAPMSLDAPPAVTITAH